MVVVRKEIKQKQNWKMQGCKRKKEKGEIGREGSGKKGDKTKLEKCRGVRERKRERERDERERGERERDRERG